MYTAHWKYFTVSHAGVAWGIVRCAQPYIHIHEGGRLWGWNLTLFSVKAVYASFCRHNRYGIATPGKGIEFQGRF